MTCRSKAGASGWNIQKTLADFYRIKGADMYSKKRPASIARPRQIAMYPAKDMTQKSLPEIGELFGGRDHTTARYAASIPMMSRLFCAWDKGAIQRPVRTGSWAGESGNQRK